MQAHVREARPDDVDALVALLAEINNLHAVELPHVYRQVIPSTETGAYLRRIIESDVLHLSVAEWDGNVVGFVVFQVEEAPDTPVHVPRRWLLISLIVVSSALRSRGIGTALMRHVQAWAQEHDIPEIELQVAEFNSAAIAWYEALGFRSRYRHMAWLAGDASVGLAGSNQDG